MRKEVLSTPPEIGRSLGAPYIFFSTKMRGTWERTETLDIEEERRTYVLIFSEQVPSRAHITFRLAARGVRIEVIAVFLGTGHMRSNSRIEVHHEAPDTYARIILKAAWRDTSHVDFSGMLNIHKGADGSDSYLSARALMLSEKAIARIDPQLEILAHNVKASHGATIGRMGTQELFYLQSRGLTKQEAERVLMRGFFEEALARMPQAAAERVRSYL